MMRPVVYISGPIAGCTWDEATSWRNQIVDLLPECDVRNPMRGKEFLKWQKQMPHTADDTPISSQRAIVMRDHWDVKNSNVLIVNLGDAKQVSIGTCFELAWAWSYRIPAILIMEDGNPNDHPFIREASYVQVNSLSEAIKTTRQLLNLPDNGTIFPNY